MKSSAVCLEANGNLHLRTLLQNHVVSSLRSCEVRGERGRGGEGMKGAKDFKGKYFSEEELLYKQK